MQIPNTNYTPEFLYKYRSLNDDLSLSRLKEIIVDKKLYFSRIDDFNDPFEFLHDLTFNANNNNKINFINKAILENKQTFGYLERCGSNEEIINKFEKSLSLKHISQFYEHSLRKKSDLGVLCLSSSYDNINLWSHYADAHKGGCIKFKLKEKNNHFFKVIYTSDPRVSIYDDDYYKQVAKFKWDKFWNHEEEFRAINIKGVHDIQDLGLNIDSIYLGIKFYENSFALSFINEIEDVINTENIQIFKAFNGDKRKYSIKFNKIYITNIKLILNNKYSVK